MRPGGLCQVTDDRIYVLNVIDYRPVRVAETIIDWRPVFIDLGICDDLRGIANVSSVDLPQFCHDLLLLLVGIGCRIKMLIDEVVIAGELPQTILTAKFIETRNPMLTIANDVQGSKVNLFGGCIQSRQQDVLHKLWMVMQRQQAKALTPERNRPVRHAARPDCLRRFALKRRNHRNLLGDPIWVAPNTEINQIRNQGMKTIDRDKFFREIKWRAEVVDAAVDALWLRDVVMMVRAAESKDAGPRRKDRIPFCRNNRIRRFAEALCNNRAERI